MPRKYNRRRKKRKPRRRRKNKGLSIGYSKRFHAITIPRFPMRNLITKLKYVDQIEFPAFSVGEANTVQFSCNSIHRPKLTGATTGDAQPLYFDELANLWNSYSVLGSKIKVQASNLNLFNMIMGIYVNDESGVFTNEDRYAMQINSRQKNFGAVGSGKDTHVLTNQWSYKRNLALGSPTEAQSVFTTDPAIENFYNIFAYSVSDSATTSTFWVQVEIEYTVLCSNLKTAAVSML